MANVLLVLLNDLGRQCGSNISGGPEVSSKGHLVIWECNGVSIVSCTS